jgi:hypothetical protein
MDHYLSAQLLERNRRQLFGLVFLNCNLVCSLTEVQDFVYITDRAESKEEVFC